MLQWKARHLRRDWQQQLFLMNFLKRRGMYLGGIWDKYGQEALHEILKKLMQILFLKATLIWDASFTGDK